MTTYTQEQRNALIAELSVAAGLLSVGQVRDWDDLSETLKCAANMLAAPSTIGFNGLTEAETDESMSVRGLSQKATRSTVLPFEILEAVSNEYNEWILFHDAGGEYESFLKMVLQRQAAIKGGA